MQDVINELRTDNERKNSKKGHSQLQLTTDLYMHVTTDSLFKGLEQFEERQAG